MHAMSKARKSNSKNASSRNPGSLQPLSGLQKAAFWSVPAVGVLFVICAATIGVLFFTQSNTASEPVTQTSSPAKKTKSKKAASSAPPKEKTPVAKKKRRQSPKKNAAVTNSAPTGGKTMSLTCADGKILFEGKRDLQFPDNQPTVEVTEGDFACVYFNGVDESAQLPPVSRSKGSLELVVRMPSRRGCTVLDSSFQRLTLRKSRDQLEWAIVGGQNKDSVRQIEKRFNFKPWFHIMMTWKSGEDAILYVDGVEVDRFAYVHEQPHLAEFEKVVLGKSLGTGKKFFESRVYRMIVYDQVLPAAKVSELNQSLRKSHPFIFK